MSLKMALQWRSNDSSLDINLRFQNVINKGFTYGGLLTGSGVSLLVDVDSFVLVNYDGALIISDAVETLTVIDGQINYVVCRARYRDQDSPILTMQVMTAAAYAGDPELNWLHVVGVVDLLTGGPYTSVPASTISYTNRHSVDQLGRAAWRAPVSTFASLPTTENREGDTRLVLDTGSLYWWDDSGQSWEIFDEVPLQNHRDKEHKNGITGDSGATTLEPNVSGTNITVAAVPSGSAYTANDRILTAPASPLSVAASTVGAIRGLIQLAMDETGASVENFRVNASGAVSIAFARVVDISEGHGAGTFGLTFNSTGGTLSWNGGAPVTVVTGSTYRLLAADGTNWIDVSLVGAAPGTSPTDNYDVNASLKVDDYLLIGHWYWDGSSVLVLGADKRVFGNLDIENLSDDFLNNDFHPRWEDLRGDMVFSGGDVSDLGGLTARIEGPIVAYLLGRRYEAAGIYGGIALTDNTTNYIYIDSSGTLAVSTTAPTGTYAGVAEVVTSGAVITGITDTRTPILVAGTTTKETIIQMSSASQLRWVKGVSKDTVNFERDGTTANVDINADEVIADSALVTTSGAVTSVATIAFTDANATAQSLSAGTDTDIADHMVGDASPSLIGASRVAEIARKGVRGIWSGCAVSRVDDDNVQVAIGSFIDQGGKYVQLVGTTNVSVASDGVYIIHWDGSTVVSSAMSAAITDDKTPLAVVVRTGTLIDVTDGVKDCRMWATGSYDKNSLLVGPVLASSVNGAQFPSLASACLYMVCFNNSDTTAAGPKELIVRSGANIGFAASGSIDFNAAWWGSEVHTRVGWVVVHGAGTKGAKPYLNWNVQGPAITFSTANQAGWSFYDVNFTYNGLDDVTNHDICMFKDPGSSLYVGRCEFGLSSDATHLINWTNVLDLGGKGDLDSAHCTVIDNCNMSFANAPGAGDSYFYMPSANMIGKLVVTNTHMKGTIDYLVSATGATNTVDFLFDNCYVEDYTLGLFQTSAGSRAVLNNCTLEPSATSAVIATSASAGVDIIDCALSGASSGSVSLSGARLARGCDGKDSIALTGATAASIVDCDFETDSTFSGAFRFIRGSKLRLTDGLFLSTGVNIGGVALLYSITDCRIVLQTGRSKWLDTKFRTRIASVDIVFEGTGTTGEGANGVDYTWPLIAVACRIGLAEGTTVVDRSDPLFDGSGNLMILNSEITGYTMAISNAASGGHHTVMVGNDVKTSAGVADITPATSGSSMVNISNNVLYNTGNTEVIHCIGVDYVVVNNNIILSPTSSSKNLINLVGTGGVGSLKAAAVVGNVVDGDATDTLSISSHYENGAMFNSTNTLSTNNCNGTNAAVV